MPAELEPAEGETCATPTVVKHVAAKKLRVDDDTGDTRVLGVSADGSCVGFAARLTVSRSAVSSRSFSTESPLSQKHHKYYRFC